MNIKMQDAIGTVFYTDIAVGCDGDDIYSAIINAVNYDALHARALSCGKAIWRVPAENKDIWHYDRSAFDVIDITYGSHVHELYVQDCEGNAELLDMLHSLEYTLCLDTALYYAKEKEWRAYLWADKTIVANLLATLPFDIIDACEEFAARFPEIQRHPDFPNTSFLLPNEPITPETILRALMQDTDIHAEQIAGNEPLSNALVTHVRERARRLQKRL